ARKMERDPVCGMSVDPLKAKEKVKHGGKDYYFCSAGCAQKFEKEPEKYHSQAAVPLKAGAMPVQIAGAEKTAMGALPILEAAPRAKDPVCGMMVDPQKAAGKVEHGGKTFFFCSPRCKERFQQ